MKIYAIHFKKLFKKKSLRGNNKGFTFPELIVVLLIFSILTAFITINLVNLQRKTDLNTFITTLVAEIKNQQVNAMTGNTEGRTDNSNYGIHFDSNRYVLYHGDSYNPNEPSNFITQIDPPLEITNISIPSGNVLFESGNGKFKDFISGQDYIIIQNTQSSEQKTIKINKYGVITQAD